jgi:hypothetical protein
MSAAFQIKVDPTRSLVRITLSGFFSAAYINEFMAARDKAHLALRCAANEHVTLVDIRDMSIQSPEAVALFQHTLDNPAMASRRLAIVLAEKSLCRLQIRRAASNRDAQYFDSVQEAEAFVLGRECNLA